MKADVLSGLEEIKAATAYTIDGKESKTMPYSLEVDDLSPVYTHFSSWQNDLTHITSLSNLPDELKEYMSFIENYTGIDISLVSVGPDRKQTIEISR